MIINSEKKQTLNCKTTHTQRQPYLSSQKEQGNTHSERITPEQQKHKKEEWENYKRMADREMGKLRKSEIYEEGEPRQEMLSMQHGNRTLIIASLSPANFTSKETKIAVIQMLQKPKIYIAAIQETHTYRMVKTTDLMDTELPHRDPSQVQGSDWEWQKGCSNTNT